MRIKSYAVSMKKGTLVIRCSRCGNVIGHLAPKGKGAKVEYEERLNEGVKLIRNSFGNYYWCGCR